MRGHGAHRCSARLERNLSRANLPGRRACCPRGAFVAVLFLPCLAACYAQCNAPTITSITPDVWFAGQTFNITIAGTSLDCGGTFLSVEADQETLTPATLSNVTWSANQVTALVSVPADTPTMKACVGLIVDQDGPIQPATANAETGVGSASPAAAAGADASGACGSTYYYEADKTVHILAAPTILWNGNPISGGAASAQSVVVGQPINLTTTPTALIDGIKIKTSKWTVGGTNIAGYNVASDSSSAGVAPTDVKEQTLNTYWVYPTPAGSSGFTVAYHYCVSNSDVCSPDATATLNVTGPSATVTPTLSNWYVSPPVCEGEYQILMFGTFIPYATVCNPTPFTEGIHFQATLSNVPASGGTTEWVQVISKDTLSGKTLSGSSVTPTNLGTGLDTEFPYPPDDPGQAVTTETGDSPLVSLDPSLARETRTFKADMYYLWTPQIADSLPVPLGYVHWVAKATALQDAGNTPPFSLGPTSPTAAAFHPATDTGSAHGYPTWTKVATGSSGPAATAEDTPLEVQP